MAEWSENVTIGKTDLESAEIKVLDTDPDTACVIVNEIVNQALDLIENFKQERIEKLDEQLNQQFDDIELQLAKLETENELDNIRKEFESAKSEILYDTSEVFAKSERIKQIIQSKKEEFEEQTGIQYQQHSGLKKTLMEALNRLNETQKSLVMLKDYEGYSYEEIGQIMNLNESQVKVYLHRARLTLKNYLVSADNVL